MSPRAPRCDEALDTITVCGKKKDNAADRLPLPGELSGATNPDTGVPHAPDVMANRITGKAIGLGCGLMACPREMLPDIDFRAIPAAPGGSDADRIGKGEIRRN